MPQATDEQRAKWADDDGVGEGKATKFLEEHGWTITGVGCWNRPTDRGHSEIGADEWEALDFLVDEWDHDYIPHPEEQR